MLNAEQARLAELRALKILDTEPQEAFDRITTLASQIFKTPVAIITFIDEHRQWFKSSIGLNGVETPPRDISFCTHTVMAGETLVVLDTTKDDRFNNNILVTEGPKVRFYAGAPLITQNGYAVGSLCIIDMAARESFSDQEKSQLEILAKIVMGEIDLINKTRENLIVSKAKNDFLAHMTHEIRTPLNAILGAISIYPRLGEMNQKQETIIDTMNVASINLRDLINNFLDLAKIDNSSFALTRRSFNYETMLTDIGRLFRFESEQKGLSLVIEKKNLENFQAFGDATRLRQIIVNLTSNAIKYSREGTIEISAFIEEGADTGKFFVCEIRDQGIGIAQSDYKKIFKSFEQLDNGLLLSNDSTGLGLSISRKLARAMNGDITFTSILGEGSAFTIRIPHVSHEGSCAPEWADVPQMSAIAAE